jgi:hypothetical protein
MKTAGVTNVITAPLNVAGMKKKLQAMGYGGR